MASKVRRVRCPRCLSVLEEMPRVLLYRCGGCGNTLEAKNRKLESDQSELSSQETNNVVKTGEADVSEDKEARSSVHVSTGPSSLESSPDKDSTSCRDGHRDSNGVICEERGVPDVLPRSHKGTSLNEGSPGEDLLPLKQDNHKGEGSERCNRELHNDKGEWIGSSSSGIPSSGEFTHEVEVCAHEPIERLEQEDKSYLQEDNKEGRVSQRMWQEGGEFADAVRDSPDLEDTEDLLPPNSEPRDGNEQNDAPPENDEKGLCSSPDQEQDSERGINLNALYSSSGFVSHENREAPHLAEQGIEADDMAADSPLTTGSEKIMNFGSSDATSQRSFNDSLASYLTCPEDEPFPSEGAFHGSGKTSTLADLTSQLSLKQRSILSNLPTASAFHGSGKTSTLADLITSQLNLKQRSILSNLPTASAYHGYGGSGSVYDSIDEQNSARLPSRKGKDVDNIRTTEMLIKNRYKATDVNSKPERVYNTSSSHRAMRNSHWGREKYAETTGYASEHNLKRNKQRVVSSLPRYSGDQLAGSRTHGHSISQHNLLPPRPHLRPSSQASYLKMDKLDLLRTVDALKDQVNRMQFPQAITKRRFSDRVVDEKFNSFNYDRLAAEHEIYPDLNRPGAYLRHDQTKGCPEQYNISRMGYSREAAHHARHISCSCLHSCPQEWHYSAQFPMRFHHLQNDRSRSTELSLYDTKSDNLRLDEIRSHMQEKRRAVKRYARPVAGAAPFLACYHCSKLLQLPADFLIFKKRYHELMCNACRKVLKFSLEKGTHLVPYIPDASAPPPSEADNYSRNLERPSHSNSCPHVEAGWAFCRRCSLIGALERIESVGSSTRIPRYRKSTSEIKDLPPSSTHRLHRLMGYSSPSQVFD